MTSSVFVWSKNRTDIRDGNEYKIWKWLVLKFHGSGQIILHLNKITECLKMTTFKIVFTFDVFLSAETTMHCKLTCILYKKQAHFSQLFCLQIRSVTPWQLHDRKSRCLRGRRHSSILYSPGFWIFFQLLYKWSKFLALQKVWFSR